MNRSKADLFLSLPADVVSEIDDLLKEAYDDGYQNGYADYGDELAGWK